MKPFMRILAAAPICAGLIWAQDSSMNRSSGQSWSGLLVAADCGGMNMARNTASGNMASSTPRMSNGSSTDMNRSSAGHDQSSTYEQRTKAGTGDMSKGSDRSHVDDMNQGSGSNNRRTPTDNMSASSSTMPKTSAQTGDQSTYEQQNRTSDRVGNADRMSKTTDGTGATNSMDRRTTAGTDQNVTRDSNLANSHDDNMKTKTASDMNRTSGDMAMKSNTSGDMNKTSSDADMNKGTSGNMKRSTSTSMAGSQSDKDWVKTADASCRIGANTSAFALRTDDGTMVRFDDASNAKIASQLQSGNRVSGKTKIFKTKINGTKQGDTITLSSIQI